MCSELHLEKVKQSGNKWKQAAMSALSAGALYTKASLKL